jgi:glutathione S-transferase
MKIYGVSQSRAARTLWAAEELGLKYEHVPTMFFRDTRKPEFLEINPNGHIPTLVDGDLVLWESMAINLYLARKHDGGLWPKSVEDEAHSIKWSFWAMTECEPPLMEILINRVMAPEDQRDPAKAEAATEKLSTPLGVLDKELSGKAFLLGDAFSIADLNVASVLMLGEFARVDMSKYAETSRWYAECTKRPACQKARSL